MLCVGILLPWPRVLPMNTVEMLFKQPLAIRAACLPLPLPFISYPQRRSTILPPVNIRQPGCGVAGPGHGCFSGSPTPALSIMSFFDTSLMPPRDWVQQCNKRASTFRVTILTPAVADLHGCISGSSTSRCCYSCCYFVHIWCYILICTHLSDFMMNVGPRSLHPSVKLHD